MSKVFEVCVGCALECDYHNDDTIDFLVPGELLNKDSENIRIFVKTNWLDKNARKVGYACLDELFFYDSKIELLEKLTQLAIDEKAIIRII